jgi:hypothetical protein
MKTKNITKHVIYNQLIQPPIPFQVLERSAIDKGSTHKMELRVNPADVNSETYRTEVQLFSHGPPEAWFQFVRDYKKVEAGQQLNTGPMRFATMRNLLFGEALRVFEQEAMKCGGETVDSFTEVLNGLATYFFPVRALSTQKRFMRRYLIKPMTCKIREYVARLHELNAYLVRFPPFKENQPFSEEELAELLEHSLPTSWQRQMMIQGVSASHHSMQDIVEFCERIETLEDITPSRATEEFTDPKKIRALRPKSRRNGRLIDSKWSARPSDEVRTQRSTRNSNARNWCVYHKTNTHDMSQCKVMIDQAKKMRANWMAQPKPPRYNNKTSVNKKVQGLSKNELHSMIKTYVKRNATNQHYNVQQRFPAKKPKKVVIQSEASEVSSVNSECHHMDLFKELSVSDQAGVL